MQRYHFSLERPLAVAPVRRHFLLEYTIIDSCISLRESQLITTEDLTARHIEERMFRSLVSEGYLSGPLLSSFQNT